VIDLAVSVQACTHYVKKSINDGDTSKKELRGGLVVFLRVCQPLQIYKLFRKILLELKKVYAIYRMKFTPITLMVLFARFARKIEESSLLHINEMTRVQVQCKFVTSGSFRF
jgi:hypothetical protein